MRNVHGLVLVSGLLVVSPGSAGELTPYPSPAQQSAPLNMTSRSIQAPVRAPESTYQRFAKEISTLKPAEREALAQNFEERRVAAVKAGEVSRELHYLRLLETLRRAN